MPRFKYGTGSNYAEGVLGHDDVLRVGPSLIERYPLLRLVVARRFPFIFVDESQDANPQVVAALRRVAEMPGIDFCVGFFGDPMQKIYLAGAGAIEGGEGWNEITKPENFRCPLAVLEVINKIRAEDDGLAQIPAKRIGPDGPISTPQGTARLFIAPAGRNRGAHLAQVRQLMAESNADPLWQSDGEDGNVRLLVLVHRMAASRLGFPDLYAALNDHGSSSLKEGLLEGTAWVLRPFLSCLLPLVVSARAGDDFDVISSLRRNCPLLAKERLAGQNVAAVLTQLRVDLQALVQMLSPESEATIRDVIAFVHDHELAEIERFGRYLQIPVIDADDEDAPDEVNEDDADAEERTVAAFFRVAATQLWGYRKYVEDQSPFSTQQGIKGAEFQRVLVILDDEESEYSLFSYGKYWGIEPASAKDQAYIAAHYCPAISRTESTGWNNLVDRIGSRGSEVPVKWVFSRTG